MGVPMQEWVENIILDGKERILQILSLKGLQFIARMKVLMILGGWKGVNRLKKLDSIYAQIKQENRKLVRNVPKMKKLYKKLKKEFDVLIKNSAKQNRSLKLLYQSAEDIIENLECDINIEIKTRGGVKKDDGFEVRR